MATTDSLARPAAMALTRATALAQVLDLEPEAVATTVSALGDRAGGRLRIAVPSTFDSLSVAVPWPTEASDQTAGDDLMALLGAVDPMFRDRIPMWRKRPGQSVAEFIVSRGRALGAALWSIGRRELAVELDELAAHTHAGEGVDEVRRIAAGFVDLLGRRTLALIDRFTPPAHHDWRLSFPVSPRDSGRIGELAYAVGVDAAACKLIANLHDIGGSGRSSLSLRLGPGVLFPEVCVVLPDMAIDSAIEILIGFEPPGCDARAIGDHLGRFAGALGVSRADEFAVTVAAGNRPRAEIRVDMESGCPRK